MKPIVFALPDIGEEEIERVTQCLRSGWLTTGPMAKAFEQDFIEYLGGGVQAVAVNSATSGLQLALEAAGVARGDEVITTAYTFSATAMAMVQLGAFPVFIDIDPVTLNMDISQIEAAITPKTKAIVPVHFAGLACDMAALRTLADRYNLKIIDDAAHALPTTYKGTLIGACSQADATVFSFYATKTITTGEGGMVVTRDAAIADRCRLMRLHGISRDVFDRYTSPEAKWYYEVTAPGYKFNLPDIAAAIGIEQLKKAYLFHEKRVAIKNRYKEAFAKLPLILPAEAPEGELHAWHLFVIRLTKDAGMTRDEFISRMQKEHAISCSVHFMPLPLHPFWGQHVGAKAEHCPRAVAAYEHAVSLPLYTKMSEEEIQRVIHAVTTILG